MPKSGKVSCAQNRFIILDYPLPPNKRFGIVYQDFTFIQFRLFRTGSSVLWDMMLYSVFFLNERKILWLGSLFSNQYFFSVALCVSRIWLCLQNITFLNDLYLNVRRNWLLWEQVEQNWYLGIEFSSTFGLYLDWNI